jgi:uncharacterized C2H2 Zn-finger protein
VAETTYFRMVGQTERDGVTWYVCEKCGMMFDNRDDAQAHEDNCDTDSPDYVQ